MSNPHTLQQAHAVVNKLQGVVNSTISLQEAIKRHYEEIIRTAPYPKDPEEPESEQLGLMFLVAAIMVLWIFHFLIKSEETKE